MFDPAPQTITPAEQVDPVTDLLIKAKAVIDTPDKWFSGEQNTLSITPRRCAMMAIWRCQGVVKPSVVNAAIDRLVMALPPKFRTHYMASGPDHGTCVVVYNDSASTTHADIMALYDRAIADR